MPQKNPMKWKFPGFACLFYSLLVAGCCSIPDTKTNQTASPATVWTTKANPIRGGALPGTSPQMAGQIELMEPRTIVHFTMTSKDPGTSQTSGNAIVGPDGSIVIGGFGPVQVGGLTVGQATAVMEKQFSQFVNQPSVKLTVAGPIQPVQAIADWNTIPPKGNNNPPVVPNTWQPPIPGQVVTPDYGTTGGKLIPLVQNPSPDAINNSNLQIQPGTPIPRNQPSGEEIGPKPRPLANNTEDSGKTVEPGFHLQSQVAIYPQVPTEVKPVTMPTYIVGPPDILQIDSLAGLLTQQVRGPHLIRPDGTIGVGIYGSVYVAGMTLDQAKEAIARVIHARLDPAKKTLKEVTDDLSVDVLAYNSKVYYVITDRVGFGEIVARFPITGYETVLDAISQLSGLPPEAAKHHIWVARRCPDGKRENILPVDWIGISQKGLTATNYQLLPGDRVYVRADRLISFNYVLSKFLAPIERLFGVALLSSQTINSIKSGTAP